MAPAKPPGAISCNSSSAETNNGDAAVTQVKMEDKQAEKFCLDIMPLWPSGEQLRFRDSKGREAEPVDRAGAVSLNRGEMLRSGIAFMFSESVLRIVAVIFGHQTIPG